MSINQDYPSYKRSRVGHKKQSLGNSSHRQTLPVKESSTELDGVLGKELKPIHKNIGDPRLSTQDIDDLPMQSFSIDSNYSQELWRIASLNQSSSSGSAKKCLDPDVVDGSVRIGAEDDQTLSACPSGEENTTSVPAKSLGSKSIDTALLMEFFQPQADDCESANSSPRGSITKSETSGFIHTSNLLSRSLFSSKLLPSADSVLSDTADIVVVGTVDMIEASRDSLDDKPLQTEIQESKAKKSKESKEKLTIHQKRKQKPIQTKTSFQEPTVRRDKLTDESNTSLDCSLRSKASHEVKLRSATMDNLMNSLGMSLEESSSNGLFAGDLKISSVDWGDAWNLSATGPSSANIGTTHSAFGSSGLGMFSSLDENSINNYLKERESLPSVAIANAAQQVGKIREDSKSNNPADEAPGDVGSKHKSKSKKKDKPVVPQTTLPVELKPSSSVVVDAELRSSRNSSILPMKYPTPSLLVASAAAEAANFAPSIPATNPSLRGQHTGSDPNTNEGFPQFAAVPHFFPPAGNNVIQWGYLQVPTVEANVTSIQSNPNIDILAHQHNLSFQSGLPTVYGQDLHSSARGKYRCGRCGQPKVNHHCEFIEEINVASTAVDTVRLPIKIDSFLNPNTLQAIDGERLVSVQSFRTNIHDSDPAGFTNGVFASNNPLAALSSLLGTQVQSQQNFPPSNLDISLASNISCLPCEQSATVAIASLRQASAFSVSNLTQQSSSRRAAVPLTRLEGVGIGNQQGIKSNSSNNSNSATQSNEFLISNAARQETPSLNQFGDTASASLLASYGMIPLGTVTDLTNTVGSSTSATSRSNSSSSGAVNSQSTINSATGSRRSGSNSSNNCESVESIAVEAITGSPSNAEVRPSGNNRESQNNFERNELIGQNASFLLTADSADLTSLENLFSATEDGNSSAQLQNQRRSTKERSSMARK